MQETSKLSIKTEQSDKATIMVVVGRIDGATVEILESAIQEQIKAGHKTLVFDFKELNYISSAGWRALLIAARQSKKMGGRALCCNLTEHIAKIFEIGGLKEIVNTYPTRTDALEAL